MSNEQVAFTVHEVSGIKFEVSGDELSDIQENFLAVYSSKDKAASVVVELIRDGYDLYDMSPIEVYE